MDQWSRGRFAAALLALAALATLILAPPAGAAPAGDRAGTATAGGPATAVIVRALPGAGDGPERLVAALGGTVGRRLGIIDGFTALVPAAAVDKVEHAPGVRSVTRDSRIHLLSYEFSGDGRSMYNVAQQTGAAAMWSGGWTGKGVDVALIDSGVAPVNGLSASGKVVYGPDLSFESQSADLRYLDTYGHGTHMAGIIAGRDDGVTTVDSNVAYNNFVGVAPDAHVVSIKVADSSGATDISQVIAAIDWVVQHRGDNGMNIRVLNLSFGTDGTQDYRVDPLAYAAEVAWRAGIVVVVAGGNAGYGSAKLNDPAYDPFVLAVGADDSNGTIQTNDDRVPSFSSSGDATRGPDVIAPGTGILSLDDPGSAIDTAYPGARVGSRSFRGSGTSQATAVVSGAAALLLQQHPTATPDQVKALLTGTATAIANVSTASQGHGLVNLAAARTAAVPAAVQSFTRSTGTGSLDLSRGSAHLVDNGVALSGEKDIFGASFNATQMALLGASGTAWQGGLWNGSRWAGDGWSSGRWLTATWAGTTWAGTSWSSIQWDSNRWSSNRWSGVGWSSNRWSSNRWSDAGWSSASWG